MEILNLEGTEDTPKIILDKKNGIFEISGRSLRKILPNSTGQYWSGSRSMEKIPMLILILYLNSNILIRHLQNLSSMFFPRWKTSKP